MTARVIRPLVIGDIAELQVMDNEAHGEAWSHRTFLDEIEETNRLHLVAEVRASDTGSAIVGHASGWMNERACHITNVAVRSNLNGHGHASALLMAVIRGALDDYRVMNLQLEVRPTNRRAQRLYSRFGFVPVGIERNFYDRSDPLGNRDAVVMAVTDVCSADWRARLEQIENDQKDAGAAA